MTFNVIDGPMAGSEVNLSKSKYVFWSKEGDEVIMHEYRFNLEDMTMTYVKTWTYKVEE